MNHATINYTYQQMALFQQITKAQLL